MNLAVTKRAVMDVSGQKISEVPEVAPGIQTLNMIGASGSLGLLLDSVSGSSQILTHVNVSSCSLKELSLDVLCRVVAKPKIDCFDAANMRDTTAEDLQRLLESLNSGCRVLNLGGILNSDGNLCRGGGSFDFSVLSKFNALESLSLDYWLGLTSTDLSHLPKSIKDLSLAGAEVRSFEFLRDMTGLVHLDLDGVRLTPKEQDSFMAVVSEKENLKIRINIANRLPDERAISHECMVNVPIGRNITFY